MSKPLPVALPFDPNPRAPGWQLPDGACDTHFHIFGPPDRFPYAATRRYEPPVAPIEYYFEMQRIAGLSRGVAVQPTAHGFDNSAVLDAIAKSGGRLRGVISMNADMSDGELRRMKDGGVVGARFSLMSDRAGDRAALESQIPRMLGLGWSLDLHIEPKHLLANEAFIRSLPITTVIDHMGRPEVEHGLGQPAFRLVLDLLRDDRFWTKICASDKLSAVPIANVPGGVPYRDVIPFAKAVIEAAPDRVIWGTDWPHGSTFKLGRVPNEGALLDLLGEMVPEQSMRRRILVDNPARLYGFA
jgi:predicted TIM-barrel fold metal-dependent hydrolase